MSIQGIKVEIDENFNLINARIVNVREFVDEFGEISLNSWKNRYWPIFQRFLVEKRRTEILTLNAQSILEFYL